MQYLAKITTYDATLPGEVVRYYATDKFTTRPSETPANTLVDGRIRQPALIRRDIFDVGTTGGASRVGFGELVLANEDGALDFFADEAVDGRTLEVYTAASVDVAFPGGWDLLFTITMQQADRALDAVTIRLRDRQAFTEQPLQATLYAGNNALPDGLEGIESDLRGKPKPKLYGRCLNLEPVLVNTSRLIYQVNDGAVRDVLAVYDSGALLARGANYADTAAMLATEPDPGEYRVCQSAGYFRIGSSPVGVVTCDAVQGVNPPDRTAAAIFATVLDDIGIDSGDIDTAALDVLDAANRSQCGFYYRDVVTVQDVLDDIARSVGAWWGQSRAGLFGLTRLTAPSGSAVLSLTADNIASLIRVPVNDDGAGLPATRVTVRAARNYTVQTTGLAGVVGAARRARLAQPYQERTASDSAVLTTHPLAPSLKVDTGLACMIDAQTEATRLLALYGERNRYEVQAFLTDDVAAALDLGAVVSLAYPRYGLTSGVLCRVIGYSLNPASNTADLTLWG